MTMTDLSDAEVICGFMEPMPVLTAEDHDRLSGSSPRKWWQWWEEYSDPNPMLPRPRQLDLDALWLVEEKLIRSGRGSVVTAHYNSSQLEARPWGGIWVTELTWHLAAAQKIVALAKMIREVKC